MSRARVHNEEQRRNHELAAAALQKALASTALLANGHSTALTSAEERTSIASTAKGSFGDQCTHPPISVLKGLLEDLPGAPMPDDPTLVTFSPRGNTRLRKGSVRAHSVFFTEVRQQRKTIDEPPHCWPEFCLHFLPLPHTRSPTSRSNSFPTIRNRVLKGCMFLEESS